MKNILFLGIKKEPAEIIIPTGLVNSYQDILF